MRLLLSVAVALGILISPLASAASATGTDLATSFDAVLVVDEGDLPALLDSGALGEYALLTAGGSQFGEEALLTPADLGLDPGALLGGSRLGEDALLTPSAIGLDAPHRGFFPGGFFPGFRGFGTLNGSLTFMFRGSTITETFTNVRVPVFRFGPFFGNFGFSPFRTARTLVVTRG